MSELGTCLDSESIGAFADGALRGDALAVVSEHLLTCDECLSAVGAANRAIAELGEESMGTDEMVEPIAFQPRRQTGKWLAAAAAIAATAVLAVWLPMRGSVEYRVKPIAAALKDQDRPIGPRLTGLPWGEWHNARGGPEHGPSYSRQAAVAKVLDRPVTSPADEQAAAIANLVNNDPGKAINLLKASAGEKPTASVYSDLAGAQYQARNFADALRSADAALKLDPKYLPALFNRALILEQLYPTQSRPVIEAWNAYLAMDKDSLWANEANEHIKDRQDFP